MNPKIEEILKNGNTYLQLSYDDDNGRYRSWEHFYTAFGRFKGKILSDENLDFLCLHLAFYLASWGMYRGSSFLLLKDYRVHTDAIRVLMHNEYRSLWAIKCNEYIYSLESIHLLMDLVKKLREIYDEVRVSAKEFNGKPVPTTPVSDTLITKILMGSLGCVPAYDRFFTAGIKACGIRPTKFGIGSLRALSLYYTRNREQFEEWRKNISNQDLEYPQMKLLDMCFWQIGYNFEPGKE